MAFRARIYETHKLSNGKRYVVSGKPTDFLAISIIKFILKAILFCCFFWIIIPIKIFNIIRRKK